MKKGFISISRKLHYFSAAFAISMVMIFLVTQGLAGWFKQSSQEVFANYSRFLKCWEDIKETDKALYRYAQTPIDSDRKTCSELLESLQTGTQDLTELIQAPEMKDMLRIIQKYADIGNEILYEETGTEERISLYNEIKEYKWILEGMYDTLYQKMQDYLKTQQQRLEELWKRRRYILILCSGLLSMIFLWWIRHFGRQIVNPLQELTAQTETIIDGNRMIEMHYHQEVRDELDILNNSFYKMVEINNQNFNNLERQRILEKRLADTKLKLLQSRVNPHFMFNTMNMIAGLAVEEDAFKTTDMLMMTAKYLRYALAYLDKAVKLEEEVGHVMDYMNIQKVRFEERFEFQIFIAEETKEAIVPSMILQPLCENALSYGMEPLKKTTSIRIRTGVRENRLLVTVEDNGAGMTLQRLAQIRQRIANADEYDDAEGIGIVNTFQRIRSFYEERCPEKNAAVSCEIESEPLICTKICFKMPLLSA